jgi:hypothetical protein
MNYSGSLETPGSYTKINSEFDPCISALAELVNAGRAETDDDEKVMGCQRKSILSPHTLLTESGSDERKINVIE